MGGQQSGDLRPAEALVAGVSAFAAVAAVVRFAGDCAL
jgi:hypothetical protein